MKLFARAVFLLGVTAQCGAAALLLSASPARAVVLLPGDYLVARGDRIELIDPGRRPPAVVSSEAVGGGEPWQPVSDIALGGDGFLYALVGLGLDTIYRIDPTSGDRELVSSAARGTGPTFLAVALVVARDGAIYVGESNNLVTTTHHRVIRVDRFSGDRTLAAQGVALDGHAWVLDMAELEDGRLLVAAGSDSSAASHSGMWIADVVVGTLVFRGNRFTDINGLPRALAPQPGTERAYVMGGLQLVDASHGAAPGTLPMREIISCIPMDPPLDAGPKALALDADGFLIIAASGGLNNCRSSGLESLTARIYRVDPVAGSAVLLHETEFAFPGVSYGSLVVVPEDHPFDERDGDGIADVLDNCPLHVNEGQDDLDGDGVGDACNDATDFDGDEFADTLDLCAEIPDPLQLDADGDRVGDACDAFPDDPNNEAAALRVELRVCLAELHRDDDGDGVDDSVDRCLLTPAGAAIDFNGCSLTQFCSLFEPISESGRERACILADWRGDEGNQPWDCIAQPPHCVPR